MSRRPTAPAVPPDADARPRAAAKRVSRAAETQSGLDGPRRPSGGGGWGEPAAALGLFEPAAWDHARGFGGRPTGGAMAASGHAPLAATRARPVTGARRGARVPAQDVLAFLLSFAPGVPPGAAARVAAALLAHFGTFGAVLAAAPSALREAVDISEDAIAYLGALELAADTLVREPLETAHVLSRRSELFRFVRFSFARETCAVVRALFVDRSHRLVAERDLARAAEGEDSPALAVEPAVVLQRAVQTDAAGVILVFFRPGAPARVDETVVETAARTAELLVKLHIALHDAIAIDADGNVRSLTQHQLLPRPGLDHG